MRKLTGWLAPAVIATTIVGIGVFSVVSAEAGRVSSAVAFKGHVKTQPRPNAAVNEKLTSSALTRVDNIGYPISGGSAVVPIDGPTTLNCKGTTSCTIEADMSVELENATTSMSHVSICVEIDGNLGCPYTSEVPADFTYNTYSMIQNATGITPGLHTVQTVVISPQALNGAFAYSTYHVYKP